MVLFLFVLLLGSGSGLWNGVTQSLRGGIRIFPSRERSKEHKVKNIDAIDEEKISLSENKSNEGLFRAKLNGNEYVYFLGKNVSIFALYLRSENDKKEDVCKLIEEENDIQVDKLKSLWQNGKLVVHDREMWRSIIRQNYSQGEIQLRSGIRRALVVWNSLSEANLQGARDWLEGKKKYFNHTMTINDQVQILLNEFKEEFPYYRDHCLHCAAEGAEYLGEITCTSHLEKDIQRAVRAELRYCSSCSKLSRFVRANDVNSIMQRKYGRCGEYSIAFAAILLIFGLDIRWIYDSSDHVWIEALINNKFIHCDPCEAALNQPLLYSQNWQKSSSLVLAFDKHQAIDLTSFYYPDNSTVATLRKNIHLSPELISSILSQYNFSASNTAITLYSKSSEQPKLSQR